jgi:hypothetical protein
MYGNSSARDILLLAAEDAFEFERWRDAGPVTADIDPEVKAAEIAEFEALGIPMPSELDGLRRELEHAPKVREAIRHSSLTLRRTGRASASSLVALGPQQLMPTGPGGMPWGWPMAMDPRMAARLAGYAAGAESPEPRARKSSSARPGGRAESRVAAAADLDDDDERDEAEPPRARSRKVAGVAVESEPVEAEVVDDFDEDDDDRDDDDDDEDEDERPHGKARRREPERREPPKRRAEPRRARASARSRDEWEDEDDNDDRFESAVAARPAPADQKITWILGGISVAAVIALLVIAFNEKDDDGAAVAQQQQQQQPLQQQAAPVQPPPPVEAVGAIDPATGLPFGQAPIAPEPAPAAPSTGGRRSSGVSSGVRSSSTTTPASGTSGGVNPFGGFKTPDDPGVLAGGTTPPASGGTTQPAAGGTTPPPSNATTPPAGTGAASGGTGDAAAGAAGAAGGAATPAPTEPPKPVEEPKPAEPPKPEEPQLTKSKMTPAIREAVVAKVGDLQACYQDAVVGKPDLAGQVVFTISLDQDGVVKKVEIAKDEVKYGVAKCSAKKIQRWTLPSAGIPIIFDLPFDFKS